VGQGIGREPREVYDVVCARLQELAENEDEDADAG
jgi:hypothetical protein